jgi:hypothetical protein
MTWNEEIYPFPSEKKRNCRRGCGSWEWIDGWRAEGGTMSFLFSISPFLCVVWYALLVFLVVFSLTTYGSVVLFSIDVSE